MLHSAPATALSIAGDGNSIKYLKAKTLEPLTSLQELYWLSLGTFMVEQDGLSPLAKLRKLKYLFISNKYKFEDVAALAGARPDVECDLFEPVSGVYDFFACKKCGEHTMILPTGKGKPWMCQTCDSKKIEKGILVSSIKSAVAGAECNTVIELKQAQHDAFPPLLS